MVGHEREQGRRFLGLVRNFPWLLFIAAISVMVPAPAYSVTKIEIATAGQQTLYYIFGSELAAFLNTELGQKYSVEVISTAGSQDNIERLLLDPQTMLALSQEDVAHFYYKGQDNDFFFFPRQNDFRITSLGRPFSEVLYCITLKKIKGFQELGRVHVGKVKSGSYVTYTTYRRYQKPSWEEIQAGNAYELLQAGKIDGLFEVEANPNPTVTAIEDFQSIFNFLPIRRTELTLGLDIYQPIELPALGDSNGGTIESVAIPTVLLCSRELPRDMAEKILEVFYDDEIQDRFFPRSKSYLQDRSIIPRGNGGRFDGDQRFKDLPLPPHPVLVRKSIGSFPYLGFIIPTVILVAIWVGWGSLRRWSRQFRLRYESKASTRAHYRDSHFAFAIVTLFLLTVLGIKVFEIQELISGREVSGSGFITMSFPEVASWLSIFLISGYSGSLFPISPVASFLPVGFKILGGLFMTYVGIQVLTYIVTKILERKGNMQLKELDGHVVVCNWNQQVFHLVELLTGPDVPPEKAGRRIVIVSQAEIPEGERESQNCLVVGIDPWEKTALLEARVEKADSIIIVTPQGELTPNDGDGIVLRTSLALKSYLAETKPDSGAVSPVSIVADLNLQENRPFLEDLGVEEIVISRDIGMRMLAQAVICPGATFFFDEILDAAPESNEVYATAMPRELVDQKTDFRLVVDYFTPTTKGNEAVVPIAIRLGRPENADLTRWGSLSNVVLVNPRVSDFQRLGLPVFRAKDEIIVLADNPVE